MICSYGTPYLILASLEDMATTTTRINRNLVLEIIKSLSSCTAQAVPHKSILGFTAYFLALFFVSM